MRSLGRTLWAGLAAAAFAGWGGPARPLQAQEPDLRPFAQAYTAAWNAHDLAAVLSFFAPDAIVRERRGDVPPDVWETREPAVARQYQESFPGGTSDAGALQWERGLRQIESWAATRFAGRHRFAADQYHAAEDTVRWHYQEFSDPYQRLPGVHPLAGTAEAVVRDGRISVLTLVLSPESVARQRSEVAVVATQRMAAQRIFRSPLIGGGASGQARGRRRDGPAAAEATTLAWSLGLSGLALLASLAAGLRRRQASQP